MFDAYERTVEFATIEGIAAALRAELGPEIEDQPGWRDPADAGQANRAYRAAARRILSAIAPRSTDLAGLLSWVLGRVARRRLAAGGLDARRAEVLLNLGPGPRDDWLAFLTLAPWPEVEHLLEDEGLDRT